MSSEDPRVEVVRRALSGPTEAFHSALAATLEEVRADAPEAEAGGADDGAALGRFASGRIDLERFAAVIERRVVEPTADAAVWLRRARENLVDLEAHAEDLLTVDVPHGSCLHDAVEAALASVGRAFGAARLVDLVRSGRPKPETQLAELMGLSFRSWSRTERLRAPPLVLKVSGADLTADSLAEFLDGTVRLVLLVSGPAPPAPLARLVTPGVFVLQTTDGEGLERLASWGGPGIAAVLPQGAACFAHDPEGGAALAERLVVTSLPEAAPEQGLGGLAAAQMAEQLSQLQQLVALAAPPLAAARPATPAVTPTAAAPTEPVAAARPIEPSDRLAAWLLAQADLTGTP